MDSLYSELTLDVKYLKAQKALLPLARVSLSVTQIEGLLGNNDKEPANDLKPQGENTTPIETDPRPAQKDIFDQFGETCK